MTRIKRILFTILLVLTGIAACTREPMSHPGDNNPGTGQQTGLRDGWVRVKMREDAGELDFTRFTRNGTGSGIASFDAVAARTGATEMRRVFSDGDRFRERRRQAGLHLWYDVKIDGSIGLEQAIAEFGSVGEIEFVEPIYRMVPVDAPVTRSTATYAPRYFNDPRLSEQWMYHNDGSTPGYVAGADINLLPAWSVCTGHNDVIVAVVDGGFQYDHPDLAANVWQDQEGRCGYNFVRPGNPYFINPGDHGTHVAGTVSAVNNNLEGVCGIAGGDGTEGSGVRIMACQIFDDTPESGYADIGEVMTYAADNGAVISQNSWTYPSATHLSESVKAAIDYFIDNAGCDEDGNQIGPMKGGIVIFAAGNDNTDEPAYPGAYEKAIAVASIGPDMVKAGDSNYGPWVNLAAPGGSSKGGVLSTLNGGKYDFVSGTSMAAPQVSGIAALAVSKYGTGEKGFTNQMLWDLLIESGRKELLETYNPEYIGELGNGLIDAEYVICKDIAPSQPTSLSTLERRYHVRLQWKVPESYAGRPVPEFEVYVNPTPFSAFDYDNLPETAVKHVVPNPSGTVGDIIGVDIGDLEPFEDYYFAVVAKTKFGVPSEPAFITASTTFNTPPAILKPLTDLYIPSSASSAAKINLDNYFRDDDSPADVLTYFINLSTEGIVDCAMNGPTLEITPQSTGMVTLTVIAQDMEGSTTNMEFKVMVSGTGSQVDLYPNPFRGSINVRIPGGEGNFAIRMYNQAGHKVLDSSVDVRSGTPGSIDTESLSPGNYTFVLDYYGTEVRKNIVKR